MIYQNGIETGIGVSQKERKVLQNIVNKGINIYRLGHCHDSGSCLGN
jgi:hypothetical protein